MAEGDAGGVGSGGMGSGCSGCGGGGSCGGGAFRGGDGDAGAVFRRGAFGPGVTIPDTPRVFETRRLRVFWSRLAPTDHNTVRDVFVACRTDEDRPMVCATAMVHRRFAGSESAHLVDWLEVTSEYRRMGLGRELLGGLMRWYGRDLALTGMTGDGVAFCEALRRGGASGLLDTGVTA